MGGKEGREEGNMRCDDRKEGKYMFGKRKKGRKGRVGG